MNILVRLFTNNGLAPFVSISTVYASTALISLIDDNNSFISEPSAIARFKEKTTSSESKAAPSWYDTP